MVANQTSSSSRDLVADLLSTNNTLNIVTVVSAFVFGFLAVYGCYLTVRHQRWERLRHRSIGLSQIPDNVSWEQKVNHPAPHQLGQCVAQGAPTVKQAVNMQVRFKTATANVSARLTLFALLLDDPELGNDEEHYAMQDLETRSEDETAIGSVHTSSSSSLGSQPPSIARNHTRGDVESVSDTSHGDEADEDTSDASGVRHYLGGGTGNGTTNEATTYAGIAAQAGSHNSGAHDNLEDNYCPPQCRQW